MESSSQQAFLYFEEGRLAGEKLPINRSSVIIGRGGRNEPCDIVLPERQVSRQHTEIFLDQGHYFMRDLGSKNGTYLNGEQVKGVVRLRDNDEIQIALCERIRFIGRDATLPLEELEVSQRLHLDRQSRRVWIGSTEIDPPLSPAQYRLLALLHERAGRVCSRDEIVEAVWALEDREGVSEQAIDALVRRLRDRLSEFDADGQYVVTVRGHGLRLDPTGGRR